MYAYYGLFLFIALLSVSDIGHPRQRNLVLSFTLLLLTLFVAFRGGIGGDGLNYLRSWDMTPTIEDSDWSKPKVLAYSEPVYYALTFVLKSIWDSPIFYFGVIATLGFVFLFKAIRSYAIYPLMALVVYLSRFFILRDFNQIRAAVAISIIIYATKYIAERNTKKFFCFWLLALCFHSSMVVVLPFYWLSRIKLTQKKIYWIIAIVFFGSFILNQVFEQLLNHISIAFNILTAYTGDGEMAEGFGMFNPMIYIQLMILVLFTANEDTLKNRQPYYYTIRNGYLYSTLLLMVFSSLLVIGARLSTVFATYEIFMIPALITMFTRRSRIWGIVILYVILALLYTYNLTRAGGLENYGDFEIWYQSAY